MIKAQEEWRPESEGAAYPLQLITDHENHEYFMTNKPLYRRQAQWSELLTSFDYEAVHRPCKLNGNANWLRWRPTDLPQGWDKRFKNMQQVAVRLQNLPEQMYLLVDRPPGTGRPSIWSLMREAYETYKVPGKILEAIRMNGTSKDISVGEWMEEDGKIQYRGSLYVGEVDGLKLQMILDHNHAAWAGQPGRVYTFDLLHQED